MKPEMHKVDLASLAPPTPEATALDLLGAISFSLTFSTLTWADDTEAAQLIHAPVHRIPKTPEAFNTWLGGEARRIREAAIDNLTAEGARYEITYPMEGFDGSRLWIEERGQRVSGDHGRPDLILGVLRDVTLARQMDLHAARLAHFDPLTDLWNRERFIEALTHELAASDLRSEPGYVAAFRLSGLEDINTNVGSAAGDFLLGQIATKLRDQLKPPNSAGRINEAVFGVLLPGLTRAEAKAIIQDISIWVSANPHISPFGELYTDCEVSGLLLSTSSDPSNQLALLETQLRPLEKGIDFSASAIYHLPTSSYEIEAADILSALNGQQLALAYQPIINAKSRKVNHFECLMRVIDDKGEPRSAAKMIMAAEELGYVHLIDQRALEIGSQTLRDYPDIHLAFNVSAGTVQSELASERYLGALRALGPDTARVTLELTETLALDDPLDASRFAAAARALGCRFAIDDFGAGHTTFQNLMTIEADIIKIDGSMVKDLTGAPHKQTFIRMIVDIAQTFGVETVAEMVNSEADAALMARMGVTYFQGYMFGMPAPLPEFGELKQAL